MSDKIQIPVIAFSRSFRGYEISEVNEYVQNVNAYEVSVQHTVEKLELKVGDLETEVARMRELESSLIRAMKMAEEAQETSKLKMDKEAGELKLNTQTQSKKILDDSQKEADKIKFLAESEKKQILLKAFQDLKEQERGLKSLKEAQREIARQLTSLASLTLEKISSWEGLKDEAVDIDKLETTVEVKPDHKKKASHSKLNSAVKAGSKENGKVEKISKGNFSPKIPVSRKKKSQNSDNSAEKDGDDGLPTLHKVLAAYAKSIDPKSKIGEIN